MNLRSFLRDKLVFLLIFGAVFCFIGLFLSVLNVNLAGIMFILLLLASVLAASLLIEFLTKRAFYAQLVQTRDHIDQKYLLHEMLEEPSFLEGRILWETLQITNKSMNDTIAFYRKNTADYQEYIETWMHEVKTPLASAKLLVTNHPDPTTQSIGEELDRIDTLLEQALFYARSSNVEQDYLIHKTDLKKLVHSAIRRNAKDFIANHITLETGALDFPVYTDEKWAVFILNQLIGNAIKYKREQDAKISILAHEEEKRIILTVRDNGIGISAADLPRVFEKGFTGTTGRSYEKSTGIGLYLCKKLCDRLGLQLNIRSQLENGTELSIGFPKNEMFAVVQSQTHPA